jgi:hypothetical protein
VTQPTTPSQRDDDRPDYGLLSDDGNARLDLLVRELAAVIDAGSVERGEAVEALSDGLRAVAAEHPEATDITVRDAVLRELRDAFTKAGWALLEPFEF